MRLKSDLIRKRAILLEEGYDVSMFRVVISDGTSANALYRLTGWLMSVHLSPFAYLTGWVNRLVNGCVIGSMAQFGEGFVIMHPVGVVINSKVRGGNNITIESGVVIGDEKGMAPILGDNVFVGSGAKVLGGVSVGNYVKIGANAVVVKNVPDNVTVVGVPAKIIVDNLTQ